MILDFKIRLFENGFRLKKNKWVCLRIGKYDSRLKRIRAERLRLPPESETAAGLECVKGLI